jgi:hypothetical protein
VAVGVLRFPSSHNFGDSFRPNTYIRRIALMLVILHVSAAIVVKGGGIQDFAALMACPLTWRGSW